jgi:diacylglycerol O-acyltransferase / wax synthase
MRQLTSLDAQFLALETPRQYGHTSGLAVLDPSTAPGGRIELADVQRLIVERLPLLPPFRWRLAEVPLGLDYPYWIDDPDFDIDFHVRELALPAPGSLAQLSDQVARIFARPLDRTRPLWELYLVQGLEGGRVALLTKIHHAVIDGMSGAEILGVLLDIDPAGREIPAPLPESGNGRAPGDLEMLLRGLSGLARYPVRALRSVPSTLPNIDEVGAYAGLPGVGLVGRVARGVQRVVDRNSGVVNVHRERLVPPRTSFNGRVSAHRRVCFGELSLDMVKEVKNAHGCTVNDVVVSICAGAVRRWLLQHQELPDEPLVAQIPVSVRTSEQQGTFGNRILLMSAPLYTEEADPVLRLRRTHESMAGMKERHRALPADLLQDANHFIPPAVFSRAARLTFALSRSRRMRPSWNLVISNVPGPQFSLYCIGARLEAIYPVSVVTDGMGLNITLMSYDGRLFLGIVADRELMPDVGELMPWLEEELELLRPRLTSTARAKSGRSARAARTRRTG